MVYPWVASVFIEWTCRNWLLLSLSEYVGDFMFRTIILDISRVFMGVASGATSNTSACTVEAPS